MGTGLEDLKSQEGRQKLAELQADASAKALAKALGHNQLANEAGTMEHEANIARKLGFWRKALRGAEGAEDLAWCRALVLLQLHDRSFASLQEEDTKLVLDGSGSGSADGSGSACHA